MKQTLAIFLTMLLAVQCQAFACIAASCVSQMNSCAGIEKSSTENSGCCCAAKASAATQSHCEPEPTQEPCPSNCNIEAHTHEDAWLQSQTPQSPKAELKELAGFRIPASNLFPNFATRHCVANPEAPPGAVHRVKLCTWLM